MESRRYPTGLSDDEWLASVRIFPSPLGCCRVSFLPFVVVHVIRRNQIEREEQYMDRIFDEEYLSYETSVRRWV